MNVGVPSLLLASMGPRLIRRGNRAANPADVGGPGASMGPRLIRRGNLLLGCQVAHLPLRFNGAATDSSRKFDELFGGYLHRRASMGPRLIRRGNSIQSAHEVTQWLLQWGRD